LMWRRSIELFRAFLERRCKGFAIWWTKEVNRMITTVMTGFGHWQNANFLWVACGARLVRFSLRPTARRILWNLLNRSNWLLLSCQGSNFLHFRYFVQNQRRYRDCPRNILK
jgi:hypothetical protein